MTKKGFRAAYPKYHAQGTTYMGLMDLDRAAFLFVSKTPTTCTLSGSTSSRPSSTASSPAPNASSSPPSRR
jgi:hypothetical protein